MKIFELHFNPKKGDDRVFDSFVYEPEGQEERWSGNLCMAGELIRVFSQNKDFLNNLSAAIKNDFYGKADFSESLKGANNFLDKETKAGNVSWLGNLNFAVINIRNSILNFTKVGNIKILLLREGEALDISQNLELQDTEPYPMKIFSSMASGKLSAQDKILILTKEVFSVISQNEMLLNQLSQVTKEKELKKIFKLNKDIISEISGICLLIAGWDMPSATSIPNAGFKFMPFPKRISKIIFLIAGLTLILIIAYFLFGGERKEQFNQFRKELGEAQSKIMMAENFIILKKEEKARTLFLEAREILLPISKSNSPFRAEASALRESIKKYLPE